MYLTPCGRRLTGCQRMSRVRLPVPVCFVSRSGTALELVYQPMPDYERLLGECQSPTSRWEIGGWRSRMPTRTLELARKRLYDVVFSCAADTASLRRTIPP